MFAWLYSLSIKLLTKIEVFSSKEHIKRASPSIALKDLLHLYGLKPHEAPISSREQANLKEPLVASVFQIPNKLLTT